MLLNIILGLIALFIANRVRCLVQNYIQARKVGLPIIFAFESWQDPLWMLLGPYIAPVLQSIGLYDPNRDLSTFHWVFYDRNDMHAKLGPAFSIVSPFKTNIMVSDKAACQELTSNWRVWTKNKDLYSIFNMFGDNVNTANGQDWQRHRRITSYAFREATFKMVWQSALSQAEGMKKAWDAACTIDPRNGINLLQLRHDMNKLAMHVLAYGVLGKEYDFAHGVSEPEPGHRLSYAEAMETILHNISPSLVIVVFALAEWPAWLLTKSMRQLQLAVREWRRYTGESVEKERHGLVNATRPSDNKDNLISALVRANEAAKQDDVEKKMVLSDQEVVGNLFMMQLAGYETTAGSLGQAIPLLAVHPDIQDWCREEVDAVCGAGEEVTYEEAYPKLVRLRALQVGSFFMQALSR